MRLDTLLFANPMEFRNRVGSIKEDANSAAVVFGTEPFTKAHDDRLSTIHPAAANYVENLHQLRGQSPLLHGCRPISTKARRRRDRLRRFLRLP
jgi:hypothetical protein